MNTKTCFRSTTALIAVGFVGLSAHAGPSYGQSGDIEEMVVTATRVQTAIDRLPGGISVLTREDIAANAWQTLPEALTALPGTTVVSSGGRGATTSIFMRGGNSDHVLVLLDGLPANDPSQAAAAVNVGEDLLGGLQRIEVVRGPAGTLYGSNAVGGVINLITRAGAASPAVAELDLAAGTDGTLQGTAGLFGTSGRLDYGLTLQGLTTDGDDMTPARIAKGGDEDGFETVTATAKAVYRLNLLSLEGLIRLRDSDVEIDDVPTDDPNYTGETRQLTWQAAGDLDLLSGALNSRLAVGRTEFERIFTNRPHFGSVNSNDDEFEGSRTQVDWQTGYSMAGIPQLHDIVAVGGVTYVHEDVTVRARSVSEFGPFDQDAAGEAESVAVFAHAQARVAGRFDLSAGLRRETPEDYGDHTTWRLGAVADLPELNSRITASAGTAFKAPGLYDRFGTNNFGYVGNPDLHPEKGTGWDVGVETELNRLTLGALYFRNDIDDLIQFVYRPDFTSTVENIGEAEVEGVELTAELRPADWASVSAAYTWTDARNALTGDRLLRRPEHALSLSARLLPLDGVSLAPTLRYVGRRMDVGYGDDGSYLGTMSVGGYWQADLAVTYDLTETLQLYARIDNLTDRTIEDPSGFARPDRGALGGVRVRL